MGTATGGGSGQNRPPGLGNGASGPGSVGDEDQVTSGGRGEGPGETVGALQAWQPGTVPNGAGEGLGYDTVNTAAGGGLPDPYLMGSVGDRGSVGHDESGIVRLVRWGT